MARLEHSLLQDPLRLGRFFAAVFVLLGLAALVRSRTIREAPPTFEANLGKPFESVEL